MTEYAGFDVSKEETAFCIKDGTGRVLAQGKTATDPAALFEVIKEHCLCPERIVMETGTLCHWLVRELGELGLAVDLIDARQAHAVMKLQHNKTDANDANLLAEIARSGFCRPVVAKGITAQMDNMALKGRALLVRQRRDIENTIRGLLATLGHRFAKGTAKFGEHVRAILNQHGELKAVIEPLLAARKALSCNFETLDGEVVQRAKTSPECRLLMTVPGVGPVTALAYLSTIETAERFAKSRSVGAYAGLTTRRNQSGEMDWSGRISKHGDAMLRALLYEAANSMLEVVKKAHPLKDWARKIRKRSSHKKACVALARKLAVTMHAMLKTGEEFRWPPKQDSALQC